VAGDARELHRVLGTRDLAVYYVSSLVGAGILVVPGIALDIAGPASLVGWLILSAAALPIAGMFARFSAQYPNAGGVSFLVRRAYGWQPGISVGLFLLFLNLATNPILGLVAARYLAALFGWHDHRVVLLAGFAVMSLGVLTNMLGIRLASRVQFALVVGLIVGLLTVVAVSLPAASTSRLTPFAPHGWTAVGAAILVCFFSFFGWENVSHYADEVREPRKSYPRAALVGALVLGGLYCTLALTAALVIPSGERGGSTAVLAALLRFSHGQAAARLGSALAVALLVVTTNAWVLGCSRLLYAMARDRVVAHRLSVVSGRNGTPLASLTVVWVCYAVDFFVLLAINGDERLLIAFVSASILVIYVATFIAGFRLFADLPTRLLCTAALVAVTAFLVVGGIPALIAVGSFAVTVGYVVLRRRAEPAVAAREAEPLAATADSGLSP
jgi:amino acid efflux transporter